MNIFTLYRNATLLALIPLILTSLFFAVASPALAEEDSGMSSAFDNLDIIGETGMGVDTDIDADTKIITDIAFIIRSFLGLMGVIVVILIMYSGFLWMTAGGNEEKVSKAKKMITNAVIGLVIIMAAYSITAFVFGAIEQGTS